MIRLEGQQCVCKTFQMADAAPLAQLVSQNKDFWGRFEPLHRESYYTTVVQREKIRESIKLLKEQREYSFGIYEKGTHQLVGTISLYSIKRLPFLSGMIGYAVDQQQVGKGYAKEAIALVTAFAFTQVQLNRVEAYVSPYNEPSVYLLSKSGFYEEGYLNQLLYINGQWMDHLLFAQTKSDFTDRLHAKDSST
uniref:GNAT family N-acetyltransferase n=1 Tax=Chryseomicrobium sp. FSL W7-1435 TaxID=2921704 RepID=UPI00406C35D4